MILLDTHIWIWWIHGDNHLTKEHEELLQLHEKAGLGVSVISCWEVAKLVEYQRLELPCSVSEWITSTCLSSYSITQSNSTNCDRINSITPTLSS